MKEDGEYIERSMLRCFSEEYLEIVRSQETS
jgi:hypothetical protein